MGMMMLTLYALWHFNQRHSLGRLLLVPVLLGLSQVGEVHVGLPGPPAGGHPIGSRLAGLGCVGKSQELGRAYLDGSDGYAGGGDGSLSWTGNHQCEDLFNPQPDASRRLRFHLVALPRNPGQRPGFLGWLPIPLPYPYLQGLDLVSYRDQTGYGVSRILLLGKLSPYGFPDYYFIDLAIKTPLPLLIAFFAGLILFFSHKPGRRRVLAHQSFLLILVTWALVDEPIFLHATTYA